MNEQLIKFIELCLMDGVISDKEREVIFRKSKELGVPDDECEIILEGMIQQKGGLSETREEDKKQTKFKTSNKNEIIEFTYNNLNNSELIKNELKELELKLDDKIRVKENLQLEYIKKVEILNSFINEKDIKYPTFTSIKLGQSFDFKIVGKLKGGHMLEDLILICLIDKNILKKITSRIEGVIYVCRIWLYWSHYYVVFKKEGENIVRYLQKQKIYIRPLDENDEQFRLLNEDIGSVDKKFLNSFEDDIPFKFEMNTQEFSKNIKWTQEIEYENLLQEEFDLIKYLSVKTIIV
jgi:hypothetical protein